MNKDQKQQCELGSGLLLGSRVHVKPYAALAHLYNAVRKEVGQAQPIKLTGLKSASSSAIALKGWPAYVQKWARIG